MHQTRWSLDYLLDALAEHRQRATYGAVGELLDRPPLFLMQGRPRDFRHSWIVAKDSGLPSGYSAEERDPHLLDRDEVLKSGSELEFWLRSLP